MRSLALALSLAAHAPTHAQGQPDLCERAATALEPSRDLYCIELIAAPGMSSASGHVELAPRAGGGPFTMDVTPAGALRYSPILTLAGLPDVRSLSGGLYFTYIAWVATPMMYPVQRLGVVANGRVALAAITLDKFIILVTAETSADASEPAGRIVLRGASPSTRLQPPDLSQFTIGATRETEHLEHAEHAENRHVRSADHERHNEHGRRANAQAAHVEGDPPRWTMVPMPPGLAMLPAEVNLRPTVDPYLPRPTAHTPNVRSRQLVRLKDGDTLRLTAGVVRRHFRGRTLTMFAFNGQQPGPLLDIAQGARVTVKLTNTLDQPTTIHWHGVRLENRFDGTPDLTQKPVPPGGRFTYTVRFPDAGIYWYHPHVREDIQQGLGLYGNIVVRSPRADYFSRANREEILMLDDLLVNSDGLVPFGATAATHAFMGRFGNILLVNGEPKYDLSVRRGEVVRFLLTNVSNTRTFNLSFPGARMKVVAADAGNYEREEWVESVVIAPAERYVVHVRFDREGDVPFVNAVQSLDHLFGRFYYETDTLGVVQVARDATGTDLAASFDELREDTAARTEIERYRKYAERSPDKSLVLSVETKNLPFFTRAMLQLDSIYFTPVEWTGTMPGMNWASTADQVRWVVRDPATGKENMDIDWSFRRGDVVLLRIANARQTIHGMQHPIHLHGQRFLVTAVNGVRNTNLAWKDTVLIPVGFTVDLLVDLSNPGTWMLHCHIAEHLSSQMMTSFTVH